MKSQSKLRVLYYVHTELGRDLDIFLPLYYYLKEILGAEVKMSVFYDVHQIKRFKPDIVFLPNIIGINYWYKIGRICEKDNIPLFALDSEGNFKTDGSFQRWGYNIDEKYYQEYICCWSKRTRDYIRSLEPDKKERVVAVGNVGADRYKIYSFQKRTDYLKRKGKEGYKYVVGYAAWAFGKPNYPTGRVDLLAYFGGDESKLDWIEPQRQEVEAILEHAIKNNPDVLFLLKVHPLERKSHERKAGVNEIDNLTHYENVIYEDEDSNIEDLINVCDIWTSFESTTSLEAWYMNKYSLVILTNPDFSQGFKSTPYDKAQPQVGSGEIFQSYIDEYKKTGRIEDFHNPELTKVREQISSSVFGFDDGYNQFRALYYLKKTIDKSKTMDSKYRTYFKYWFMHRMIKFGKPFSKINAIRNFWKFKKFFWVFDMYDFPKFYEYYKRRKPDFDAYYEKHDILNKIENTDFLEDLTKMNRD